jgi:hypothetical protein
MRLNPPVKEKTTEEIGSWNPKSAMNKIGKKNYLICLFERTSVTQCRMPLDGFLRLKKALINKGLDIGFGELTG